jgi:hypothetical protein
MIIDLRLVREYGLTLNTKTKYHVLFCCCTWTILRIYTGEVRDCEQKGFYSNQNVWEILHHIQAGIEERLYCWSEAEDDTTEERRMQTKYSIDM